MCRFRRSAPPPEATCRPPPLQRSASEAWPAARRRFYLYRSLNLLQDPILSSCTLAVGVDSYALVPVWQRLGIHRWL